jgi:hypothetical protein
MQDSVSQRGEGTVDERGDATDQMLTLLPLLVADHCR